MWRSFLTILLTYALFNPNLAKVSMSRAKMKSERRGRFLWNIIQFSNDVCNTTSADVQGVCYTASECSARGGSPSATCAAGFGTCCTFAKSCYGVVNEPVSHFRNPSFPLADSVQNYCTYNAQVSDRDVCQIRLDFQTFYMSGPSMLTSPFGQCSRDRMAVFSSQNDLGLSEGNLLCGDMTGQHIYVPVDANPGPDQVSLFAMVGYSSLPVAGVLIPGNYSWDVRVEQIDCTKDHALRAPDGCLQYFTEVSGTLESFNFADTSTPYPISLDYAVCIKKSAGFCGVSVNTFTVGDSFGLNANSADPAQFFDEGCSRATATDTFFNADYIAVLGGNTVLTGVEVTEVVRFCGVYDASVGGTTPFPGVTSSFSGPIVFQVRTDDSLRAGDGRPVENIPQAISTLNEGRENGFRLSYSLTANCFN